MDDNPDCYSLKGSIRGQAAIIITHRITYNTRAILDVTEVAQTASY